MAIGVLIDTGPLVAYFAEHEARHRWAVETLNSLAPPIVTCEAVLSEAAFLMARNRSSAALVLEPVERGRIRLGFSLGEELSPVRGLMQRYVDVPMSLADACLVRMAEMTGLPICTLDSDFRIYRTRRRDPLELIMPDETLHLHEA